MIVKMTAAKSVEMMKKIVLDMDNVEGMSGLTPETVDEVCACFMPLLTAYADQIDKELKSKLQQLAILKRTQNPYVVARALDLYAYNVNTRKRVEAWWDLRFPGVDMQEWDYDKWQRRFGNRTIPMRLDDWSHVAYVQTAMDRYGEDAANRFGASGFYTTDEIMANEDSDQFGQGMLEALKEMQINDTATEDS